MAGYIRKAIALLDIAARAKAEGPGPDSSRNKIGYVCPACRARVWGKPGLLLLCEEDGSRLRVNRR